MNVHGRFVQRAIGLIVLTFFSTSCSLWQPVTTYVPDRVRLTKTDSQRIVLRQAVTVGDSIVGVASGGKTMRVPRDSILTVEAKIHSSPLTALAVLAGLGVGVVILWGIALASIPY